jgi:hypothetical protein
LDYTWNFNNKTFGKWKTKELHIEFLFNFAIKNIIWKHLNFLHWKKIIVRITIKWRHYNNLIMYIYCKLIMLNKKQIMAQQPFLVRASPFGISRQICFFNEIGLSDQCPQPLLYEEKTLTYPGFKPGTFGFQVGNAANCYQCYQPLRSLCLTITPKAIYHQCKTH